MHSPQEISGFSLTDNAHPISINPKDWECIRAISIYVELLRFTKSALERRSSNSQRVRCAEVNKTSGLASFALQTEIVGEFRPLESSSYPSFGLFGSCGLWAKAWLKDEFRSGRYGRLRLRLIRRGLVRYGLRSYCQTTDRRRHDNLSRGRLAKSCRWHDWWSGYELLRRLRAWQWANLVL